MRKVILATMIAMGMTGSAFAVTAQSGIYVGALGGWSFPENPSMQKASSDANRNYTYGATVGYNYAFTPNWLVGLEASYVNFGYNNYQFASGTNVANGDYTTVGAGNIKVQSWGVQIMGTSTYLWSNGINVFGKFGAIDEKTETNGNMTLVNAGQTYTEPSESVTSWLPAAAVGVGYMPIQNLNITLQYEYTAGDNWDNFTSNPEHNYANHNVPSEAMAQNAITLGVTYNFAI